MVYIQSLRGDLERYLTCITSVSKRQVLARFRMGVSFLRVESGRYESNGTRGIPSIQMRVCKCCDLCKVEDEIHFLFECPLYHTLRESLHLVLCSEFIQFDGRSVLEKFVNVKKIMHAMSDDHVVIIRALASYLWRARQLRSKSLN